MKPNWYEDFFRGVVVDMWREAASPEQTRIEVEFLERALRLQPGCRVLDVPCGFGRHAVALAQKGYDVTGIDVSAEMLEAAKGLQPTITARLQWRLGDMRQITAENEYDAAFCAGNSFGYLDRTGTRQFLAGIARALKKGGRFVFDYGLSAESILPRFTEREWAPINGLLFLEANRYDVVESCVETTYTFVRDGKTEQRVGLQWVYTAGEVRAMLEEAGLVVGAQSGGYRGEGFELRSPVLVIVAEKR